MAEQRLLARYVSERDTEAFRSLVALHENLVYATCRRVLGNSADAEDATQESFFTLARKPEQVRGSLVGWLHRVALNTSINMARRARSRSEREAKCMREKNAPPDAPLWDDVSGAMDEAINALPDDLRIPIIRYYLERHTQEEIAREMEVTHSAISKRLQRGVDELRGRLAKAGITLTAAALGALLLTNAAEAAPIALTAALGKVALASGVSKAGGAAVAAKTGGIVMKIAVSTGVVAIALTAGIVLHSALADKAALPATPSPQSPAAAPAPPDSAPKNIPATDPLVQEALLLDAWVQAEKAAGLTHFTSSSIQVLAAETKDSVRIAAIFEAQTEQLGDRYSRANRTLKIGRTTLPDKMKFYDCAGESMPATVEMVDAETGFCLIRLTESAESNGVVKFVVVTESVSLQARLSSVLRKDGPTWRCKAGNGTPLCLNYYTIVLPPSAIYLDSYPQPVAVSQMEGRTKVIFRAENGEEADTGNFDVQFLWPEKDGTTLADVPKERRGLREQRDILLDQFYQSSMAQIRAGMRFEEQDTPVKAILSWNSALMARDAAQLKETMYAEDEQALAQAAKKLAETNSGVAWYFVNHMTFLSTPQWPDHPAEGTVHSVLLCYPGTLMRSAAVEVIFHNGEWRRKGATN